MSDVLKTPHLSERTQADIHEVAEETYDALATEFEKPRDRIHRIGLCVPATRLMQNGLLERGYQAGKIRAPIWILHYYVSLPSELSDGARVFVDATWQQFLKEDQIRSDMPEMLMGTGDEVVETARGYGVGSRELDAYRPDAMQVVDFAYAQFG